MYANKKQTWAEPNTVRKRTDKNNIEVPPRLEQNILNKNKVIQSGEKRKCLEEDKKYYACSSTEYQIKECIKKRNMLVKYNIYT